MFTIRPAIAADADACGRIHIESRAHAMPWLAVVHPPGEVLSWFGNHAMRQYEFWVAERDGGIAGYMALDGDYLSHLYVDPAQQGQGIGLALLNRAKVLRPSGFRFFVFQRNTRARRFYERNGCRLVSQSDGIGNEEHEPDALYIWP